MPEESEESGNVPQGLADVCDSVRNLRAAKRMTQQELARLAGLSEATIKKFDNPEEGWSPSRQTLKKLSRAFDLNESHLLDIREGREPKIPASKPKAKRRPEDYLEEISRWMRAVDQHLGRVDARLDSIDTALGKLAPRPDIFGTDDPPRADDQEPDE